MANLVPIFEREIELRKETSFPHSLWIACNEVTEEDRLWGGPATSALYREALIAIADASGIKQIGKEHVAKALEFARLRLKLAEVDPILEECGFEVGELKASKNPATDYLEGQ